MRRSTLYLLLAVVGSGCVSASSPGPKCTGQKDEGTGTEKIKKYFYDLQADSCVPFYFKGTGGNGNRFDSDKECVKACSPKALQIYPTDETSICSMEMDEGTCFALFPMYYYNAEEKICRMFIYRGCRGNANRFESREECQQTCLARSGRLMGAADLPNPDEKTVDAGLIVGVLGGLVFAGAVIAAVVMFVLQKKSKKSERKPVPTSDIELK
ncbi:uncharacterized protein LOC322379 precursor [Danio rerio]|uniref:Uncharacterized protein LOC322379 precursor n=1 Tax=Danio rerio TaxID=7955 RepID=E7FAB1_DANRE|nr:uncharacterized protein LOC322379 precursor [Danio rerio]|eukprot:XP_003199322.1 boophilin-H2 [Danio rerio]